MPRKDPLPDPQDKTTDVPIEVGMDKDAMARAETQNRQVGVDDSREVRETLHDAAKDSSETVDLPVRGPLHPAARQAIADQDADADDRTIPKYDPNDKGVHSVTINDQTYVWRDGEEKSVPKEALEVYARSMQANNNP
jgi:hypothetical protein